MGSTTDWVSGRARAVPVSLIRRMFDMTPRVPGAISLAVGEPGFATPPHIVEAACQALHDGFTKYSPNPGYLDLREAIADRILEHREKYGITYRVVLGHQLEAYAPVVQRLAGA